MSAIKQLQAVRAAQASAAAARHELAVPAQALLARGQRHPLVAVGVAAGAGFVLGQFNVHPLRIPGLGMLLSGTVTELVSQGVRLVAEFTQGGADPS
jgi:hypothetical protein